MDPMEDELIVRERTGKSPKLLFGLASTVIGLKSIVTVLEIGRVLGREKSSAPINTPTGDWSGNVNMRVMGPPATGDDVGVVSRLDTWRRNPCLSGAKGHTVVRQVDDMFCGVHRGFDVGESLGRLPG